MNKEGGGDRKQKKKKKCNSILSATLCLLLRYFRENNFFGFLYPEDGFIRDIFYPMRKLASILVLEEDQLWADIVVVALSFNFFFDQSFYFIIFVLMHQFFLKTITLDRSEPLIRTNFIGGNYYQLPN